MAKKRTEDRIRDHPLADEGAAMTKELSKWCEGIPPHRDGCDCAYCTAAAEIKRLNSIYADAVKGRREFRRALKETRERAAFGRDRTDPATWVLHLLAHGEISVGKAGEWLRHYIQSGQKDSLPEVGALS